MVPLYFEFLLFICIASSSSNISTRCQPFTLCVLMPGGLTDQVHALRAAAAAAKVPVGVVSTRNVLKK